MKLITWNTQWCKGLDGTVSPSRIIDSARALGDFDVLCLQEISANYPLLTGHSPIDQPKAIEDLLPGYSVVWQPTLDEQPAGQTQRQQFGHVIASRLPVLQIQTIALPSPTTEGHPHPWMLRSCTVCTVLAAWGPVRVMTTHLEYYSETQRLAQAQAIRQWHQMLSAQGSRQAVTELSDHGTPYQPKPHTVDTVLCGDFNFEPDSPAYLALTSNTSAWPLLDSWRVLHKDQAHLPTFRLYDDTYGPDAISCDFFFVSESLRNRVVSVKVDTLTQASDHQPVFLELAP
jgi:endonuclease/exonuclease/phosphatase family metal-dependent hydrolase